MRRLVVLLLITSLLPAFVQAQSEQVIISEVLPDPASAREFVEIYNPTGTTFDLTDWHVRDTANNRFTFGAALDASYLQLAPGQRLVIWGGGESDARGPAWTKASVWNNGGDQVFLVDAALQLVDGFAYGGAAWPDGRNATSPAAPAAGQSLSYDNGQWHAGAPTPGTAVQSGSAQMSAQVTNVAPTISFTQVPTQAAPAEWITLGLVAADDNGDVVAWQLTSGYEILANGTDAGQYNVNVQVPADTSLWALALSVTDGGGLNGNATAQVNVRQAGLLVTMPIEGIHFPAFPPGAQEVVAEGALVLANDASESITPRIDISDLAGPQSIPVEGRLDVGITSDAATQWIAYNGPMTQLPALDPGQEIQVVFRLRDIPLPLAAGSYNTSFTVVA
jgi:hypothetical protein